MASPNATITAEPFEGGSVVYAPLAPHASNAEGAAQLSLRLRIKNDEASDLIANAVAISFVPPPVVNPKLIAINLALPAAQTTSWFFAVADTDILPFPAPPLLTISVWCNGFDSPATMMLPLTAHVNPVAGSAYLFPARSDDLKDGEYWQGRSAVHAPAGQGWQLFAYDLGVVAYESATGEWNEVLPGGSSSKNEDYRVWGKPIYAMADGTVESFDNDEPTNPAPPADLSPPAYFGGNHFYLDHGTERVLYAHFQPGTLNQDLLTKGAAVTAGDFLGLAGNSGNSTAPHLHIHAYKPATGDLRPLLFRDAYVVGRSELEASSPSGPWVKMTAQALPSVTSLIWPAEIPISWLYPVPILRALDPLAVILAGEVYAALTKPNPPPLEQIRQRMKILVGMLQPNERDRLMFLAQSLGRTTEELRRQLVLAGTTPRALDVERARCVADETAIAPEVGGPRSGR